VVELPASLSALRRAVLQGDLSAADAVRRQHARLRNGHAFWHCASWVPDEAPAPGAGPLAGAALAHKDIFMLAGRAPGLGLGPGRPEPQAQPAEAIRRLSEAGAVVTGALAMAEYACGSTGDNDWLGRCVNPQDGAAVVGGSSSGCASAVAAGLTLASLGTDTFGSVRIPAATCGVVGFKPTWGAISNTGVQPLAPSLDTVGVLARNSADVALLFEVLDDPARPHPAAVAPSALRVAAWLDDAELSPEVAGLLRAPVRLCGAREQAFPSAEFERLSALAEIVLRAESARTYGAVLAASDLPPRARDIVLGGLALPRDWHGAALHARSGALRDFVAVHFSDADVLMLPALPRPVPDWRRVAPGNEQFQVRELLALHRYMGFVNYLGLPALVLPVACDANGRPVSVQLLARPHHEADLLSFAARLESTRAVAGRGAAPLMS